MRMSWGGVTRVGTRNVVRVCAAALGYCEFGFEP